MPDLILMDIVLRGGGDGAEAARQIRVATGKPVVFVTARSDPMTLKKARECEPYGYVLKPFGERELLVQIEMALYRHKMETERALARRELEIAHDALKTLQGLLPVCAGCKKIQETDGSWRGLEEFFAQHTHVELTHGFCPECEKRLYGTSSRPPFPYVLPVLSTGSAKSVSREKKPTAVKPRVAQKKKSRGKA
jgi:CheY-like chemotaxis protein